VQVVCARTNANNAKSIGPAITQDAKYSEKRQKRAKNTERCVLPSERRVKMGQNGGKDNKNDES